MTSHLTPTALYEELMQSSKSSAMIPAWDGRPCDAGCGCPAGPTRYVKARDVWLCGFHEELYG